MKKRTGILGGTFNPIHTGHLILAEQAYNEFGLDEVLIMPSGVSYQKKGMDMPDKDTRLEMCRIAVGDIPYFRISDMEIRRDGDTYTADTIEELNRSEPDTDLYFILGGDSLRGMKNWKDPDRIFKGCTVLAALRDRDSIESVSDLIGEYEKEYGAKISILHTPNIDISSSMIREFIREGRSVRYYVPESLRAYLLENGIYE